MKQGVKRKEPRDSAFEVITKKDIVNSNVPTVGYVCVCVSLL